MARDASDIGRSRRDCTSFSINADINAKIFSLSLSIFHKHLRESFTKQNVALGDGGNNRDSTRDAERVFLSMRNTLQFFYLLSVPIRAAKENMFCRDLTPFRLTDDDLTAITARGLARRDACFIRNRTIALPRKTSE